MCCDIMFCGTLLYLLWNRSFTKSLGDITVGWSSSSDTLYGVNVCGAAIHLLPDDSWNKLLPTLEEEADERMDYVVFSIDEASIKDGYFMFGVTDVSLSCVCCR